MTSKSPFTVNSIALANLRGRRGEYRLLITGIVLAIYFIATTLLFAATMYTSLREQHYRQLGRQDAVIFNCQDAPLEELTANGVFSEYGTAETVGYVLPDGQNEGNGFSIARFDETAINLARKEALEGRLPEKAGEIALERSTLARLRSGAAVGDAVPLTLLIPDGTDFLDAPVQKTFTLVGILSDQLLYIEKLYPHPGAPAYRDLPAGVLSAKEPPLAAGGRDVVNCYGRYAQSASASYQLLKSFCEKNGIVVASDIVWPNMEITRYQFFGGNYINGDDIIFTSAFFMIIALILMCATCLGIVNSFTASLESRKRQIGLLRAVGATKRQIRQVFGRETLLIAVFSIPLGLLPACLTVWGISRILGPDYIFRLNVPIITGVAAAGVLCVLLAASLPLKRAARIPPMQAVRDVDLSRSMKKSRVESERVFNVPRLIARRGLTLYKNKQIAITAMLVVTLMLLSLAVFAAAPLIRDVNAVDYGGDYRLYYPEGGPVGWFVEHDFHKPGISEQDRADAAALPTVKTVIGEKALSVKIIADKITPYMVGSHFDYYFYYEYLSSGMMEEQELVRQYYQQQGNIYEQSKAKYGYTQDYITVECLGTDAEAVEQLSPFVSEGRIDVDKLSSGEEILLVAPAEYGVSVQRESGEGASWRTDYELDRNETYTCTYKNDAFQAGDPLTLSLLYSDEPEQDDEEGNPKLPDDAVRLDRRITIGAILEPSAGGEDLAERFSPSFYPGDVGSMITTSAGLRALGFDVPYDSLNITLLQSPNPALEEYLDASLAQIAARTAGVDLRSFIAIAREDRRTIYGLLIAAGALIILFFAICASMVNNTLSARIRANKHQIGTVRAVGASEREIVHSYLWQLLSLFAWGTIIGLAAELGVCRWLLSTQEMQSVKAALPLWQPLLFVALLFFICFLNVRSKVGSLFKDSIVENIREL
jgi:ABC-type lipoprotein release transport system permease subunit